MIPHPFSPQAIEVMLDKILPGDIKLWIRIVVLLFHEQEKENLNFHGKY